jgi:antitoxin component YwqK of YwqJK toxin-antitoxin module
MDKYDIRDFTGELTHETNGQKVVISYVNGKKDGPTKLIDSTGKLISSMEYKNDLIDGEVKNFYQSGGVLSVSMYKCGSQDGPFTYFYENGMKRIDSNYKSGKLDGLFIVYDEFGDKQLECCYRCGLKHGKNTLYYQKSQGGTIFEASCYIDGLLDGDKVTFYNTGEVMSVTPYVKGRAQAYPKLYSKSGDQIG